MKDFLNEEVVDEVENVNDDVAENVEIYVNNNVKDESQGDDDFVDDVVVFLDVCSVEMDVELVNGDIDVKDGIAESKLVMSERV